MSRPRGSQTRGPNRASVRRGGSWFQGVILQLSSLSVLLLSAVAAITGSLLMLCPTSAHAQGGVPLWTNLYQGPPNGNASPLLTKVIVVDSSGNAFVTGYSAGRDGYVDYVTIKYSSSVPAPVHLDFQLRNNQLVLSWTNAGFNLQSAPAVPGTFTNIPGATSPYTNPLSGGQQFFRLKGD